MNWVYCWCGRMAERILSEVCGEWCGGVLLEISLDLREFYGEAMTTILQVFHTPTGVVKTTDQVVTTILDVHHKLRSTSNICAFIRLYCTANKASFYSVIQLRFYIFGHIFYSSRNCVIWQWHSFQFCSTFFIQNCLTHVYYTGQNKFFSTSYSQCH